MFLVWIWAVLSVGRAISALTIEDQSMAVPINRKQFLQGDFRGENIPIRPPWSISEELFIERCTRCGDCVSVCHSNLIKEGRGRFPQINFNNGGCDFCGDCLAACKQGALVRTQDEITAPWDLKAAILDSCLSLKGVVCRSCGEVCAPRTIRFKLKAGGIATPVLNQRDCTGCGECVAVCPVKAVKIKPVESHVVAA